MTAVRMSPARARQLGLPGIDKTTPRGKRRNRATAPSKECGATFCCTCDETFPRPVDEDRHFAANPDHRRYGCDLGLRP